MHEKSFSSPSTWDGVSLIDHQVRKVEGLDCINCHAQWSKCYLLYSHDS